MGPAPERPALTRQRCSHAYSPRRELGTHRALALGRWVPGGHSPRGASEVHAYMALFGIPVPLGLGSLYRIRGQPGARGRIPGQLSAQGASGIYAIAVFLHDQVVERCWQVVVVHQLSARCRWFIVFRHSVGGW